MPKTKYRLRKQTIIEYSLTRTMAKTEYHLKKQMIIQFCPTKNMVKTNFHPRNEKEKKTMRTESHQTRSKAKTKSR